MRKPESASPRPRLGALAKRHRTSAPGLQAHKAGHSISAAELGSSESAFGARSAL
jgi:hypothetical protein